MDAEVRNLIDTLARHAAASSTGVESFVAFVRANQRGNPLFAFLDPGHAHHADWLDALAQEHAKLNSIDKESVPATVSVPVRLIPAVVEDNLRWSDPYTPADTTSLEMASKSSLPVEMDDYMSLRLTCFDEDLKLYESRPGMSYSDAHPWLQDLKAAGVAGKEREPIPAFDTATHVSDGRFHGGSKVKGLGFERSNTGKTESALAGYRSMKKRGQSYGKLKT